MNHFSWIRFNGGTSLGGTLDLLSGKGLVANIPLWDCAGPGTWSPTQKPHTVFIQASASCPASASAAYTFLSFGGSISYPNGAIMQAKVESSAIVVPLEGYAFPSSQCDAAMTTCTDPLK